MKVIAIYNIKGGDGKTTTAKHIAVGLAAKNFKILLVDADGQANCSKSFVDKKNGKRSTQLCCSFFKRKGIDVYY